jgi:hypothetical protein
MLSRTPIFVSFPKDDSLSLLLGKFRFFGLPRVERAPEHLRSRKIRTVKVAVSELCFEI